MTGRDRPRSKAYHLDSPLFAVNGEDSEHDCRSEYDGWYVLPPCSLPRTTTLLIPYAAWLLKLAAWLCKLTAALKPFNKNFAGRLPDTGCETADGATGQMEAVLDTLLIWCSLAVSPAAKRRELKHS